MTGGKRRRDLVASSERFIAFDVDPVTLARRLLGQRLVRIMPRTGERLSGIIVETEAYLGDIDAACHTFNGRRTSRNESMYLPGGHAYIYFTYGMHHMLNIVCGAKDDGVAVLIRALEPQEGIRTMFNHRPRARRETDLCSGPGKLTQALQLDRSMDGINLKTHPQLFVEKLRLRMLPSRCITATPRIGVDYAGAWAKKPLRYVCHDSEHVSC